MSANQRSKGQRSSQRWTALSWATECRDMLFQNKLSIDLALQNGGLAHSTCYYPGCGHCSKMGGVTHIRTRSGVCPQLLQAFRCWTLCSMLFWDVPERVCYLDDIACGVWGVGSSTIPFCLLPNETFRTPCCGEKSSSLLIRANYDN